MRATQVIGLTSCLLVLGLAYFLWDDFMNDGASRVSPELQGPSFPGDDVVDVVDVVDGDDGDDGETFEREISDEEHDQVLSSTEPGQLPSEDFSRVWERYPHLLEVPVSEERLPRQEVSAEDRSLLARLPGLELRSFAAYWVEQGHFESAAIAIHTGLEPYLQFRIYEAMQLDETSAQFGRYMKDHHPELFQGYYEATEGLRSLALTRKQLFNTDATDPEGLKYIFDVLQSSESSKPRELAILKLLQDADDSWLSANLVAEVEQLADSSSDHEWESLCFILAHSQRSWVMDWCYQYMLEPRKRWTSLFYIASRCLWWDERLQLLLNEVPAERVERIHHHIEAVKSQQAK